jgi:putative phosphoribosyl transferase
VFADRRDAGRRLAEQLVAQCPDVPSAAADGDAVVLALPRGGVPVGVEVARVLGAPFDVLVVRKIGHPQQPELGLGAITEGGVQLFNETLLKRLRMTPRDLADVVARESAELDRRVAQYRTGRGPLPVEDRTVVVVDDGLATGGTALAAVTLLRQAGAERVVVAVPVASPATAGMLRQHADAVVCVTEPRSLRAINEWYDDFTQVPDAEVIALLRTQGSFERETHSEEP